MARSSQLGDDLWLRSLPPLPALRWQPRHAGGQQKLVEVVGLSSSIVLAADDPAVLAAFYAALLEAEATPGLGPSHWRVPWHAGAGWTFASSGPLRGEIGWR
jgi:hypothetical protein